MKIYLNLPGGPYGTNLLDEIKGRGWDGIRHDAPSSPQKLNDCVQELKAVGLDAIWLVGGGQMTDQRGEPLTAQYLQWHALLIGDSLAGIRPLDMVEIGNEPDIAHLRWRAAPEELGALISEIEGLMMSGGPRVFSASISNLNRRGLDYLSKMILNLTEHVTIAVHRYPKNYNWPSSHIGHNRMDEIAALRAVIGGRPFWVTETGWSEGPHDSCFGLRRVRLTEDEVSTRVGMDLRLWPEAGAEGVVIYQINDGPDPNDPGHHFGARRVHGTWKNWANLKSWRKQ